MRTILAALLILAAVVQAGESEHRQLIREGKIAVGMTIDEVRQALGAPDKVELRGTDVLGKTDVWFYTSNGFYENLRCIFLNGKLISATQHPGG